MSQSAYLMVTGQVQGKIKGPVTLTSRKDAILVLGGTHQVLSPRDAATGLPTGQRQHKPLTIIKEVDKTTPLLMKALVTNELLTEVELQCWHQEGGSRDVPVYTIRLVNAGISDIRLMLLFDSENNPAMHPEKEEVSFVYERITWIWEKGGISTSDNWMSRI